ncbi:MAG: monofunctional biosynthetic peptidoglycan transglycosylase [Acidobacteria bacterium]|nr:monofunctional biosynthetic peptidoglycan transglycosylase [Acidobacteriota bacterium]
MTTAQRESKPKRRKPVRRRRGAHRHAPRRTWFARLRRACLLLLATGLGAPLAVVLVLRWAPPPTTAFMVRDALAAAETGNAARMPYRWTSWDGIAPHAALAVIASEDQKFPDHNGFDVEAIRMALGDALQGERLRGASTISQQTAKNLFLWPGRSLFRKGLEAYLTVLIELCWSKRRIMEVYLNVAEFGTGVFGITAASERFFDKRPAELNGDEAALLAAVLPYPSGWRVEDPSARVRRRQQWIRNQMSRLGGVALIEERLAD